jgi:hypothetical protein
VATPRVTIDQLPIQAAPEDTNEIIVQDAGVTKRLTVAALLGAPSPPLTAHIDDTTDAHDATAISATAAGTGVDGANVQLQLGQLATIANSKIDQTAADARYVNLSGDTMTGALALPLAAPTLPEQAANKQYVDDSVTAASEGITEAEADARYVNLTGDTMTGALTVEGGLAVGGLPIANVGTAVLNTDALSKGQADGLYVNTAGDTMTGALMLATDPSAALEAATKQYVDTHLTSAEADSLYVNVGGDTMTGALTLAADPAAALQAATKQYIDQRLPKLYWQGGGSLSGFSAETIATQLTIPSQPIAGKVLITCGLRLDRSVVGDGWMQRLRWDTLTGAQIGEAYLGPGGQNNLFTTLSVVADLAAGASRAINMTIGRYSGTGVATIYAGTLGQNSISVLWTPA